MSKVRLNVGTGKWMARGKEFGSKAEAKAEAGKCPAIAPCEFSGVCNISGYFTNCAHYQRTYAERYAELI